MTYTGQIPPSLASKVDPRIIPFFERFYSVSDNPTAHDDYADSFLPDADFVMGSKSVKGYDQVLELRKGLWNGPIHSRKHHLHKIFPFGEGDAGLECMLYGSVDYGLKNGKQLTLEWAARAVLAEYEGKELRFKHYQVYLDSAPVANAAKD
ncbi:uncharacterized protein Z520_09049 [Fonsecaea multimorphosa CBS 102226]|uniref:SnoaL-like domain-containing protein n=1 Tax=Fonsecaea multimorphosa CBS 102226 TaxID=1442371 RepID=A0A0D2KEJ4_9EURO|nr:uncharacterized protein Z520_09049 [Fonsecaea multimorphosa CBS 102226]KIX95133.1 hypothetical protein Z520_09049 [Fonsecaea multimorphosa CBS 102226]OAL20854.1 hypothetical protein AYO22_08482 [Fonsecaea multimorphosa]